MPDFIRIDTQEAAVIGASVAKDGACRIIYITSGEGKLSADGKVIPFANRDIFVIPPETGIETSSEAGYSRIMIRMDSTDALNRFDGVTKVHDNHNKDVRTFISILGRECAADNPAHAEYIDRLAHLIISLIATLSIREADRPYVERIEHLLARNLSNASFTLDSIYQTAPNLTKDYVRRIFKQKTGYTPKSYLNRLRIEKAKELLSDKNKRHNVKQAAAACGFNDQYYFSRMFKRLTGVSPNRWQKQT